MNVLISLNGDLNFDLINFLKNTKIDFTIAVDGGIRHLNNCDIHIGDMDSSYYNNDVNHIVLKKEKDETDFLEAINYVYNNYQVNNIFVIGFMSLKRPEHFLNNIKHMDNLITFISNDVKIIYLKSGINYVSKEFYKYLSVFIKFEDTIVSIKNAKYEIENKKISVNDTYLISNEFINNEDICIESNQDIIVFKSID